MVNWQSAIGKTERVSHLPGREELLAPCSQERCFCIRSKPQPRGRVASGQGLGPLDEGIGTRSIRQSHQCRGPGGVVLVHAAAGAHQGVRRAKKAWLVELALILGKVTAATTVTTCDVLNHLVGGPCGVQCLTAGEIAESEVLCFSTPAPGGKTSITLDNRCERTARLNH